MADRGEGSVLALRYGAEVSLRAASGRWLSVKPIADETGEVHFGAAVDGIGLGSREEAFELCSARRDAAGAPHAVFARYGDAVALRSRLARQKCLGADGGGGGARFTRNLVGGAERWEVASTTRRRGDVVCSGDAVVVRNVKSAAYLAGDAGLAFPEEESLDEMTWVISVAGAPRWAAWHDDRPHLSGKFVLDAARGDDAANQPGTKDAEADLVDDVLSALVGREGGSVRVATAAPADAAAPDDVKHVRFVVSGAAKPDRALEELARRCLPAGECFVRCRDFARTRRRHEYGRVAHALAAAVRELLREYAVFVAQLETRHRRNDLRLQQLWYALQPALTALQQVDGVVQQAARLRGGKLLDALHDLALDDVEGARLGGGESALQFLADRAARPYMETLRLWVRKGILDDPYHEFLVAEETRVDRSDVATDFNAAYWESRFYARPDHAVGALLTQKADQIVVCGKYVHVVREYEAAALAAPEAADDDEYDLFDYVDLKKDSAKCARVLQEAYDRAASRLHVLLSAREGVLEKLLYMKRYFLASQGDFIVNLLELAGSELRKRTEDVSESRVSQLVQLALVLSGGQSKSDGAPISLRFVKAPFGVLEQLDAIHTQADPTASERALRSDDLRLTGAETFSLDVTVEWPASIVLSRRAIVKYQLIFRQVFWLKYVERELLDAWTTHMEALRLLAKSKRRSAAKRARQRLGKAFALRHRMLHFAQSVTHYVMSEVVEARHAALLGRLGAAKTVDDMTTCHDAFLDLVLRECLLTNHDLLKLLAALVDACAHFAAATRRFFGPSLGDGSSKDVDLRAKCVEDAASEATSLKLVDDLDAQWTELFHRFLDRLQAECHLNSHFVNLYNRLHA